MRRAVFAIRLLPLLLGLQVASPESAFAQLTGEGSEYWTQNVPGVPGDPESADLMGYTLASGDFDGDGFDDLAIDSALDGEPAAGAIHVLYGGPAGFSTARLQYWTEDSPGVPGTAEAPDKFGLALAAGDFDDDGFDDLGIGIPGKQIDGQAAAGSVVVLFGGPGGLDSAGAQLWDDSNLPISLDLHDGFGSSLAAGHFDQDAFADLAIGAPRESVLGVDDAGAVLVLYGSVTGLTATGVQTWHQDVAGVAGEAEVEELFGYSLASGDFDGDAYDDLAVGVVSDIVDGVDAGSVNVLYGSSTGLAVAGNQLWNQGSSGLGFSVEAGDGFGWALAAGDFRGDGVDGLAVGVPFEAAGSFTRMGVVHVLNGSISSGLTGTGAVLLRQGVSGLPGDLGDDHRFGSTLAAGDFEGDGFDDLAIGALFDDAPPSIPLAGTVTVLSGAAAGLQTAGSQYWSEASPGVPGVPASGDGFGTALVAGDFRGDGGMELAIGASGEEVEGVSAGAAIVLNGVSIQIFLDGFESGDSERWDSSVP